MKLAPENFFPQHSLIGGHSRTRKTQSYRGGADYVHLFRNSFLICTHFVFRARGIVCVLYLLFRLACMVTHETKVSNLFDVQATPVGSREESKP